MRKLSLALKILRQMDVDKVIISFFIVVAISAIILARVEPQIDNVLDGIWYCFIAFTTVGFGDIVATTAIGRIITVLVTVYGVVIIALITGVLASYYQEINKIKARESVQMFINKLEDLPNLSKEELTQISKKIKQRRYKL